MQTHYHSSKGDQNSFAWQRQPKHCNNILHTVSGHRHIARHNNNTYNFKQPLACLLYCSLPQGKRNISPSFIHFSIEHMQKLDSVYEPLNCASVERGKNFQFRLIDGYVTGFGLHPLQGYLFLRTFTNIIYVIHALHFAERKNSTKNLKLKWKVVYGSHHYTLQSTSFANTSVLHISVLHSSFLVSNCIRVS